MSKKLWVLLLMIGLLTFAVAGCGGSSTPAPAPAPEGEATGGGEEAVRFDGQLKIGFMAPMTGSEATYGKDMENAAKLAMAEINAKGGVLGKELVMVTGDDACDPQQATAAASKLVSENVVAVVGGYCSGSTLPTVKIYADADIPFVIVAANSTRLIDENVGKAFMINGTGLHQGEKAVELFNRIGAKKLALVHQGDGYSEDLARITQDLWEAAGNEVVAMEVVNKGEQNFSSIVTSIKSKNPDVVYWTAYFADGGLLIKQLRQGGYTGDIVVGDGSNSPQLLEIAGQASEGVYVTTNPLVEYMPVAKEFIDNYKSAYSQEPGPYSALAYDGVYLVADAIERAGSVESAGLIQALADTPEYQGLSGVISFKDDNTLEQSNFVILQAKGGKWELAE